jgi:hypothetical protein
MKKSTLDKIRPKLQVSYFTKWLEQPEKDELTKVKYLELLWSFRMSKEEIFITNNNNTQ